MKNNIRHKGSCSEDVFVVLMALFATGMITGVLGHSCGRTTVIQQIGSGTHHVEVHTFGDGETEYRLIETKEKP